ncbi:MAG: hypothetical protein ACM3ST_04935 [Bdellovibrio bacteriovorus]
MKKIITVGLLALASTMVAAAPVYTPGSHASQYRTAWSHPDSSGGGASHTSSTAGLTSLDQFEQGDPDEAPNLASMGVAAHPQPAGSAMTSLQQFERGDPDTTPGG